MSEVKIPFNKILKPYGYTDRMEWKFAGIIEDKEFPVDWKGHPCEVNDSLIHLSELLEKGKVKVSLLIEEDEPINIELLEKESE